MDSVKEISKQVRRQVFDHKNFDVFLDSVFGRTLLKGLLGADPMGTVSSYIREHKTYPKAVRNARLETQSFKREALDLKNCQRDIPSTTRLTRQIDDFLSDAENNISS